VRLSSKELVSISYFLKTIIGRQTKGHDMAYRIKEKPLTKELLLKRLEDNIKNFLNKD
jgi:hypothetical protein